MCVMYSILCLFPLAVYANWIGIKDAIYLYFTVISVGILYNALMYYGCYLFNSSMLVMLMFVMYSLFVASPGNGVRIRWYYINLFTSDKETGIFNAFFLVMVACIFFTIGRVKNKAYRYYN